MTQDRQRKRCLPESVVCHDGGERADVDAPDDPVVEECERKVEDEGAPDRDVVPHRPVLGVQRNLQQTRLSVRTWDIWCRLIRITI